MTGENRHAPGHESRQEAVDIGGESFWADPPLVPLLRALNGAGLRTRSHCAGHGADPRSWVAIRADNIEGIEVRRRGEYDELLITWRPR